MSYIHREYLERFSGYFGKTLRGFFFDEPYANRNKNASFAWTGKLFPEFRKRYGYSLEDNLGLLIAEDGQPETVKTRIDYMRLLTDLFSSNFARKVGEWCAENGVLATGHCMAEETVSLSGKVNGDIHEFIKWIQVPGMDMLSGCMPGTPLETFIGKEPYDYPLLMLTAKKISSTALYSGAGRSLCEVFGVRDWNCSLGQQKKDNDWLASMGISMINDTLITRFLISARERSQASILLSRGGNIMGSMPIIAAGFPCWHPLPLSTLRLPYFTAPLRPMPREPAGWAQGQKHGTKQPGPVSCWICLKPP